ncbi:phosphocarrier protein HPr [Halothiobacillus diazotrophicus]|uniref:Phosphocarrier protein HPr n=1 Tax=Halothiobacillus diazotrophicus TaxID=1860122 RepID=A0A191ZE51_9GAMM|nr:HPr family phosphocarrier protein [Halothiobacillus diazotrophicus]ANJ66151.1 phosphocarrier protein HPr [Halothiobacillus diazotrophicus]
MPEQNIEIINRLGLHARAAAKFSTTASQFSCKISVICHGKVVNGKSIMGLMMLAAARGTEIRIATEGADENEAMTALRELIENRFGEPE